MEILKSMDVIAAGLTAERTRINAISSNVANAKSTRGVDGQGPYRRKDVILESHPLRKSFDEVLDEKSNFHTEVRVVEIAEDQAPPNRIYDPDHVDADAQGFVAMPNVNPVEEMANMISANRAYQANVNMFQTTKQIALKALEIGR